MVLTGSNSCRPPDGGRGGFTLFEVLAAVTVLGFAVIALTHAVVAGQMQSHAALRSGRAVALGETMIEQILSLPYDDPGGETDFGPGVGETNRQAFDNVDDYHGYSESAGNLRDAEGQLYPELYQRFNRIVTINDVSGPSITIPGSDGPITGLTVTVIVEDETTGRQWSIQRFVPNPDQDE